MLANCFHTGSRLSYYSTLKMEETCSSVTSVDSQRTTRRYITEDKETLRKILVEAIFFLLYWSNLLHWYIIQILITVCNAKMYVHLSNTIAFDSLKVAKLF
jgi:hypothetical protein